MAYIGTEQELIPRLVLGCLEGVENLTSSLIRSQRLKILFVQVVV